MSMADMRDLRDLLGITTTREGERAPWLVKRLLGSCESVLSTQVLALCRRPFCHVERSGFALGVPGWRAQ